MAVKLFNTRLELAAIRSLCSPKAEVSGTILANLDESFFYDDSCIEALSLVHSEFKKTGSVPRFNRLVEDPRLSETARELLVEADSPAKDVSAANGIVQSLSRLRKVRLIYITAQEVMEKMHGSKVDPDELIQEVADSLTNIRSARMNEADYVHFGGDGSALELVRQQLYDEDTDAVIPTGFSTWDDRNGGFFRGSLVVLGGASGAGKSILANQLAVNQAQIGYGIDLAPLEMSATEMISRTTASVTKADSIDIILKRLSSADKETVMKRMRRFHRRISKAGGRYGIFKPRTDMTMEALLSALHSQDNDVIYIDYISLLAGVGGDDAWQKLGEVARTGKIYAENHNKVVVLLAQVSEEGKIRYSQAIKEHASVAWTFVATEETRERGWLHIDTLKSRNQIRFPFTLKINYHQTSVSDLSPDELSKLDEEMQARKSTRKSSRRGKSTSQDEQENPRNQEEASDDDMLPEID